MAKINNGNQILSETRWVAALVIPFLLVAFIILFIFPRETEKLFAWKIQPSMSAMMLGAAYAGGIYFFMGVLRSQQWHKIKVGFLPVTAFASLLGIATILHWDRFNHGHISFIAWAGLYFTAPFIVLAVWLRNRNQDTEKLDTQDSVIPRQVRLIMGAIGLVTLGISLFLFLQPAIVIDIWPWTLTPLTARVMGAMFALPGLVGLGIASDSRWSAANLILQSQSFSILLILVASARSWPDFDWANPGSWMFVGGLAAMLIGIIFIAVSMHTRANDQKH
ncbi:MAG: hypothetical protein CVU44_16255 [Chloroflexi bacterium HGW-Chloroflexi-6]|nr:MAG: hypothetical protein CVU44_16255 [Chloroflexi bacterium HGW-Chloroflexi-6]